MYLYIYIYVDYVYIYIYTYHYAYLYSIRGPWTSLASGPRRAQRAKHVVSCYVGREFRKGGVSKV